MDIYIYRIDVSGQCFKQFLMIANGRCKIPQTLHGSLHFVDLIACLSYYGCNLQLDFLNKFSPRFFQLDAGMSSNERSRHFCRGASNRPIAIWLCKKNWQKDIAQPIQKQSTLWEWGNVLCSVYIKAYILYVFIILYLKCLTPLQISSYNFVFLL